MRVLAVVLACFASTGHGRRARTASQGPSGDHGFRDAHVTGHAQTKKSALKDMSYAHARKVKSGLDDVKGGYVTRGNSGLDDMRGGHGHRETSKLDDFRHGIGRRSQMTSRTPRTRSSGYHDFGDAHVSGHARTDILGLDDMSYAHVRRVHSRNDDMRGGHGHGDMPELDDFRHGTGRPLQMTSRSAKADHDVRGGHVSSASRRKAGNKGGGMRKDISELDDFRDADVRQVQMTSRTPSQGSSGYHDFRDMHVSGHVRQAVSGLDHMSYAHVRSKGSSRLDNVRGGHVGRVHPRSTSKKSGHGHRRSKGKKSGHAHRGTSKSDDFGYDLLPPVLKTSQGYHDFRDVHVSAAAPKGTGLMN